jgi:hypothetical protein
MSDILKFVIAFSGVFILVGAIFLIIGIAMFNNRKKKERNCILMTHGKVTDMVRRKSYNRDGEYTLSWYPVIEYNVGELKFTKESPYGSYQPKYTIGQDIEVYYNPEDYDEYYIAGDSLPKTLATILTVVGIVAISIAIISAILIL